jgi:hypothetical protein
MAARTKHRLNCFCARRPLLAMYGRDERGRTYIHVKVFKQRRVFAEFIVFGGEVAINCRECFRWHRIVFRSLPDNRADLREMHPPIEVVQEEVNDSATADQPG